MTQLQHGKDVQRLTHTHIQPTTNKQKRIERKMEQTNTCANIRTLHNKDKRFKCVGVCACMKTEIFCLCVRVSQTQGIPFVLALIL